MTLLYNYTVHDETLYTALNEIADKCELPEPEVKSRIENSLSSFIAEKKRDMVSVYRIEGMYMHLIPLMAMFSYR